MNNKLKYLLPIRSILFIFIFTIGSLIVKKEVNDISNWWSIVASVVMILMTSISPHIYQTMLNM